MVESLSRAYVRFGLEKPNYYDSTDDSHTSVLPFPQPVTKGVLLNIPYPLENVTSPDVKEQKKE